MADTGLSFGPIAPHYDILMADVPYDMWAGYYRLLLSQHGLDPDRVLDVACGTGSVAELLCESGYEMTGFDLSEAMIERARAKAVSKELPIEYHVADATTLDLGKTFEGAYSFFDSLNYISTLAGFRAAIERVGAHLEPGGSFVFDLNTAYAFEQRMFDQKEKRKKAKIRYDWKGDYDRETRTIRVEMEFERDGEIFHEVHVQRAHSMNEVHDALRDAGFDWVKIYDSYTLDAPAKSSDRIHVIATKS